MADRSHSDLGGRLRRRFPSLALEGDEAGLYMTNYEAAAKHLALRLAGMRVLELCCGVGATTVVLARFCQSVTAVDISPARIEAMQRNVERYGVADSVSAVVGDALDTTLLSAINVDAVVADPAWEQQGEHVANHTSDLSRMQPPVPALLAAVRAHVTQDIVLRLPLVVQPDEVRALGAAELEVIAFDGRPRFLYAYFGSAARQNRRAVVDLSSLDS